MRVRGWRFMLLSAPRVASLYFVILADGLVEVVVPCLVGSFGALHFEAPGSYCRSWGRDVAFALGWVPGRCSLTLFPMPF